MFTFPFGFMDKDGGGLPADGTIIYDESFNNIASNAIPTVTGLTGDSKDYTCLLYTHSVPSNRGLFAQINSDGVAGNYTVNAIRSDDFGTSGIYSVSNNEIMNRAFAEEVGLTKFTLTGSSGDRRLIRSTGSTRQGSFTTISTYDTQWENTVNEVNSLTLTSNSSQTFSGRLVVYEHGKIGDAQMGNLELIGSETWAAQSDTRSFTGLDGDTDGFYKFYHTTTGNIDLKSNINSVDADSGRNLVLNNEGPLSVLVDTTDIPSLIVQSGITLSAKTGADRPTTGYLNDNDDNTTVYQAYHYLKNTATNITNLDFDPTTTVTGDVSLYKATNGLFDTMPFELVETKDLVSESASSASPIQFTGLTGDSEFLYKITLSLVTSANANFRMRMNNDNTVSIYKSTIRTNITSSFVTDNEANIGSSRVSETMLTEIYLHPNKGTGVERPYLVSDVDDQDEIKIVGGMYDNTVDEITSLEFYPSTTANVTGTVTLSKLRIV